jgi:hypothetical protein
VADKLNDDESTNMINKFYQIAEKNGVSTQTMKTLKKKDLLTALNSIDYQLDHELLNERHTLITVSRIIDFEKDDAERINKFFVSLIPGGAKWK